MLNQFSRTELLLGADAMKKLASARVAVFGIGGVGGHAVEALARSGIGTLDLIDNDDVSLTNVNRQIIATMETVGQDKVEVMKARILAINPDAVVHTHKCFYLPETQTEFDFKGYDYVVDAIDTVTGKIALVMQAKEAGTPIISSMGMGNKLNPAEIEVADIYRTSICPLARVMRRELKARGITQLKVVYTREKPMEPNPAAAQECRELEGVSKRAVPGSTSFVPSVAGLIMASEIVKDLTGISNE
ncbi:MAG: tRNA threonylcarbamoyladenosine dehydratase [Hespellia sp.]|nr:tRNA threonylcarbamoyladenosine dehydratase [Hespellia sp.]